MQWKRKAAMTATALAGATALAFGTTGTAAAAPAGADQQTGDVSVTNTQVQAWTYANVRETPHTSSNVLSHVDEGYSYSALCWTYGENITYKGYTSNIWVKLDRTWPKANGYVTAIALNGDKYGGVPNKC